MTQPDRVCDVFDQADDEPCPKRPAQRPVERSDGRLGRRTLAGAVGLTVLTTSLGTSVFFGWHAFRQHQLAAASDSALQAARDYAGVLTTLDAGHIDDNYRRSLDGATGAFKDAYSQGSAQLRQILIDNKAVGSGVVVDAAVKAATPTTVEVLLFVDQSITNAAIPSPRIDRNRIAMTMQLVNGRWLASKVDIL